MRCSSDDPVYQVTFKDEGGYKQYAHKRVGRPRGDWAETTMMETTTFLEDANFYRDDIEHLFLFVEAMSRKF